MEYSVTIESECSIICTFGVGDFPVGGCKVHLIISMEEGNIVILYRFKDLKTNIKKLPFSKSGDFVFPIIIHIGLKHPIRPSNHPPFVTWPAGFRGTLYAT